MTRSLFIALALLTLMLGGGAMPVTAFAQTNPAEDFPETINITKSALTGTYSDPSVDPNVAAAPKADGGGAGKGNAGDPSKVFGWLLGGIMSLFAGLMGYAGVLLNDAVYFTVLTMGEYINQLPAVSTVWHIMRDLGNIILIFGFLAVGVCTILGVDWYGGGPKMLPMLILAAVFINFSLFISEAVIDVGNIFASQFYTQINGGNPIVPLEVFTFKTNESISKEGISNVIMNTLGLQVLYDIDKSGVDDTKMMFIGFLGIILFIIASFVLFSLAFILIARFVILLFLIIIAPIGFAGLAVPNLKKYADQWWGELFKQTLTAPVLLLMLYVALSVITDPGFLGGFNAKKGAYTALNSSQTPGDIGSFAGILLSFLVAMGLLLACTMIAKNMGAAGAAMATKWAGKMSFGAIGIVGRNTVGAGGHWAAKSLRNTRFGKTFVGRGIAGSLEKRVAGGSFDLRGTGALKSLGIDAGNAHKGGYTEILKKRVESYEKASAGIKVKLSQDEKDALTQAGANTQYATENKSAAEKERVQTETIRNTEQKNLNDQKTNVSALEDASKKDYYWVADTANVAALEAARKKVAEGETRLASAEDTLAKATTKLAEAKEHETRRVDEEKATKAKIGTAASRTKDAQKAYGERLENRWGAIPLFGAAAREAAPKVIASAGKSTTLKAIEKAIAQADKEATKPKEKEETH